MGEATVRISEFTGQSRDPEAKIMERRLQTKVFKLGWSGWIAKLPSGIRMSIDETEYQNPGTYDITQVIQWTLCVRSQAFIRKIYQNLCRTKTN